MEDSLLGASDLPVVATGRRELAAQDVWDAGGGICERRSDEFVEVEAPKVAVLPVVLLLILLLLLMVSNRSDYRGTAHTAA